MRKVIGLFFILYFLSGCSANYDLEIGDKGFIENLTVYSSNISENKEVDEKFYPVYYNSDFNTINPYKKLSNVLYYNSSLKEKNGLNILNYNYTYNDSSYKLSNIIKNSFDDVIVRKYDYDYDGKNDYMLISTSDTFSWFNIEKNLEKVTIKIKCHYKIISSNADSINKNELIWVFTPDNKKAINLVYDPTKVVDTKSFWEKLISGDYFNIVSFLVILLIVGIYFYFKFFNISKSRNDV